MASRLSHLSLSTKKQENAADDLLAALTVLAHPTQPSQQPTAPTSAPKKKKKKVTKSRRSRFFFTPTTSFDESLNATKKVVAPHALNMLTEEVEVRKNSYSEELPTTLQANIERVREFFLNDLGPLTLAVQAGTSQAREVVQRTLNAEIDNTQFAQFERMVATGSQLLMARYIAKYLGLPRSTVEALVSSIQPKQPANIIFPALPDDERRRPKAKPEQPAPEPQQPRTKSHPLVEE